jgi:hypothetical protein
MGSDYCVGRVARVAEGAITMGQRAAVCDGRDTAGDIVTRKM